MPKRLIYLIPFMVGLALAASMMAGLYAEQQSFEQKARLQVFDKLSTIQGGLENALRTRLNLMDALRTYIRLDPDLDQQTFAALTKGLLSGVSGVRFVELARNDIISHVHPTGESGRVMERNLFTDFPAEITALADRAVMTRQTQIATPRRVKEGGEAVVAASPIFLNDQGQDRYWGLALMLIDTGTLFREAGLLNPSTGLSMALKQPGVVSGHYRLLFGNEAVFAVDPVVMTIPVPNGIWQLAATPTGGWPQSPNRAYILYGGSAATLAITGLLFTTVFLLMIRIRERDRYCYLVQNAKSIILRVNMAGEITFCNEYTEEFYGYGHGELLGKPLVGTLMPLKSLAGESMKRHLHRLLKNPAALPFNETMNICKNGQAVWVAWAHKSVLNRDGQMVELLSVGTDITDRKFMEEALRQRERQYRLLAENVTDVIFGLDADLRYTYVSPSDETLRGFKRAEVLGRPINDFLVPSSLNRLKTAMENLNGQGENPLQSVILDLEFQCMDSTTLWLETRMGLLLNDDRDVIGFQGIGRDITDRKLAEALRDDVERMARHDLKTPLGAVIGLPGEIQLLGGLTQAQEDMLATIEKAGETMLLRINHSLDLYKMERGIYALKRHPVDVLGILEEIKAETRTLIREKGINLGIEVLAPKQNEFVALVEEDLFRSMLSNLILNSLQASPEGGTVGITLKHGENLSITIRNQGEVPVPMREIFFDKYTSTNEGMGTGLGTYSARLIARTHGGDIVLDTSEPGRTSVELTLPE